MPEQDSSLPTLGFPDSAAFESWLSSQSADAPGLWLKLVKKGNDIASVTRSEAIDAALCHGWIDGQIGKLDDVFRLTRFTPRRARSTWSEVNRTRAIALMENGRVRPAGLAQIEAAQADGRWDAAYAPASTATVPDDLRSALEANSAAAAFFDTLKGPNRYAILYRIGSVKKAETRARKIAAFVDMLERGETIYK